MTSVAWPQATDHVLIDPITMPATEPGLEGLCLVLSEDGQPLCQGRLERHGEKWLVRRLNPSGSLASAYFGRGQRRFHLLLSDGSRWPVFVRNCWWRDGERVCDVDFALTTEMTTRTASKQPGDVAPMVAERPRLFAAA